MNGIQFVQMIRHGLPGCVIEQLSLDNLACRVRYGGQTFDISGGVLDGFPLWLVTTPHFQLNDATGHVLSRLDSISEEFVTEPKPWPDYDGLIKRLREIAEEDGDEPVEPI